jgi:hypothetical protein
VTGRARWLAAALLCAACKQQAEPPPPPPVPAMPAAEVKRAQDACKAYVDKVCGCARAMPALDPACRLARALPDAIQVGLDVGASADSTQRDVRQVQDSVRKIAKECIEELARLPASGCT